MKQSEILTFSFLCAPALLLLLFVHSDVDNFIEKLTNTIKFLQNIAGKGGDGESEDDFVPFI